MIPKIFRTIASTVAASAAFCFLMPAALSAQTASSLVTNRVTQRVDDNALVTLKGMVHPLANAANDRGAVPDSMRLDRIQIMLKRSSTQESALQQLIHDQHTPGTASYHKWLTPTQFGSQFGPSDQDIATLGSWLESKGFSVEKVNPGKQTLEISGSAGQFRNAFHAQIHKYSVDGEVHYANASNPQIPAALAPVLGGFAALNNFRIKPKLRILGKAEYNPKAGTAVPQWTVGGGGTALNNSYLLSPADFYLQYDLTPVYSGGTNGSGQTIAIVNDSNINVNLVSLFRSTFNIANSTNVPQVIIDGNDPGIDGVNNPDGPNGDSPEAYLDVEWSGAVAPAATVDLVIAADTSLESGLYLAAEHAVTGNLAPVVSLSFGECEIGLGSYNQFWNSLWEQAAAQGITVLVSSGDNGSAGCDDDNSQYYAVNGTAVNGFASTPYNVAVGGTDFFYSSWNQGTSAINTQLGTYWNTTPSNSAATASIQSYIPEQPWNDSQYGLNIFNYYDSTGVTTIAGGSGGASSCGNPTTDSSGDVVSCAGYAKPAWQTGTGVPADKVRDLPDVSLFAADGLNDSYYPFCYQDGDCQTPSSGSTIQVSGGGGTSFATPAFAGIMALINQTYGPQGQADYVLYPLAAQYPAAFHDVTNGTNSVPCNTTTVSDSSGNSYSPLDCISVSNPITVTDPTYGSTVEGQIGTGTTAEYNAATGYDLASGLGSVDAAQLISDWSKVKFTSSTVTLTSPTSASTFTHGQSVTFSGTVAGSGSATPTGNVAIETDSTEPTMQGQGVIALSSGSFSGTTTALPGGTYNVWANYSGDSTNASAVSSKVQITVSPEASTTYFTINDVATGLGAGAVLTAPGSTSTTFPYGTQLILSAQPVPTTYYNTCINTSNPPSSCSTYPTQSTGTVVFSDNATAVNTAVLNAEGDAEYNALWSVGSHSATAKYSGDASYNSSTSSSIAFTITKATPIFGIFSAAQTSSTQYVGNQSTVLNFLVENGSNYSNEQSYEIGYSTPVKPPTGTITVSSSPAGISGTLTLSGAIDPSTYAPDGVASIVVPSTVKTGSYTVTVSYSGDSNYSAASYQQTVQLVSGGSGLTSTIAASGAPTSTSPTASYVVTGTVTGQSGHAAPTGGVIIASSGYTVTEVGLTPGTGASSTFSVTLNSQTLFQGANYVTLQYTGDTTYNPSSTTLNNNGAISNPLSDFSMVPNTTIVPVSAGGSATDTIQLASVNGYAGTVNYTCTPASGITCSISPTSTTFTSGGSSTTTLTINAASGTSAGNYNVLVTGTDSTGNYVHTLGIQAVVQSSSPVTGSFTLSNSGSITVASPGASGTSTLTVKPSGGFTGTVSFSCSVSSSPSGAQNPPTCSAPSASVTGTSSVTSTLTVNTTAATSSAAHNPFEKLLATGGGLAFAALLFFGVPARRRSWRVILVVLLFAGIAGLGIGCGGSSGNSGGGSSGTTTGAYVVTVTATSGSLTQSATVNVTVN